MAALSDEEKKAENQVPDGVFVQWDEQQETFFYDVSSLGLGCKKITFSVETSNKMVSKMMAQRSGVSIKKTIRDYYRVGEMKINVAGKEDVGAAVDLQWNHSVRSLFSGRVRLDYDHLAPLGTRFSTTSEIVYNQQINGLSIGPNLANLPWFDVESIQSANKGKARVVFVLDKDSEIPADTVIIDDNPMTDDTSITYLTRKNKQQLEQEVATTFYKVESQGGPWKPLFFAFCGKNDKSKIYVGNYDNLPDTVKKAFDNDKATTHAAFGGDGGNKNGGNDKNNSGNKRGGKQAALMDEFKVFLKSNLLLYEDESNLEEITPKTDGKLLMACLSDETSMIHHIIDVFLKRRECDGKDVKSGKFYMFVECVCDVLKPISKLLKDAKEVAIFGETFDDNLYVALLALDKLVRNGELNCDSILINGAAHKLIVESLRLKEMYKESALNMSDEELESDKELAYVSDAPFEEYGPIFLKSVIQKGVHQSLISNSFETYFGVSKQSKQ